MYFLVFKGHKARPQQFSKKVDVKRAKAKEAKSGGKPKAKVAPTQNHVSEKKEGIPARRVQPTTEQPMIDKMIDESVSEFYRLKSKKSQH